MDNDDIDCSDDWGYSDIEEREDDEMSDGFQQLALPKVAKVTSTQVLLLLV